MAARCAGCWWPLAAATIAARAETGDVSVSHTAKLLARGVEACAQKFGEEAVEAVIAATAQDDDALVAEAGDVLYHLLVMLQARGVTLEQVVAALGQRHGTSGLAEKAARGDGGGD